MLDKYKISGTVNLDGHPCFNDPNTFPEFQTNLDTFKAHVKQLVSNKESKTFYKFGDGDYYFLKKEPRGSAKPGIRALKKPYFLINHKKFTDGAKKNDYYLSLIPEMHKKMFFETFGKEFDFPSEFVYGLTANKWLFKNFGSKIGLIGADKKIELISKLMDHDEYKEYLGLDKFSDYISIPQRFACDNLNKTKKNLINQIKNSESEVFLLGIGHVKSGVLHELKNYKKALYLDIGVGIDAIAGVININRPYFGNWKNFQFKNSSLYKEVDILINKEGNFGDVSHL